jgi:hypothetical protein
VEIPFDVVGDLTSDSASSQRKVVGERQTRADCAGIGKSVNLVSGFRVAPGRVVFRLVPAMRVSNRSSGKFGSACCRHLSWLLAVVGAEAGVEPERVLVGGG